MILQSQAEGASGESPRQNLLVAHPPGMAVSLTLALALSLIAGPLTAPVAAATVADRASCPSTSVLKEFPDRKKFVWVEIALGELRSALYRLEDNAGVRQMDPASGMPSQNAVRDPRPGDETLFKELSTIETLVNQARPSLKRLSELSSERGALPFVVRRLQRSERVNLKERLNLLSKLVRSEQELNKSSKLEQSAEKTAVPGKAPGDSQAKAKIAIADAKAKTAAIDVKLDEVRRKIEAVENRIKEINKQIDYALKEQYTLQLDGKSMILSLVEVIFVGGNDDEVNTILREVPGVGLKAGLDAAARTGCVERVAEYLSMGASVGGSAGEYSPLACAATLGYSGVVRQIRNAYGWTEVPWDPWHEVNPQVRVRALENQADRIARFMSEARSEAPELIANAERKLSDVRTRLTAVSRHIAQGRRARGGNR